MTYRLRDRAKEWTSYVGIAAAGLGAMIPEIAPVADHWAQFWQAGQMFVGAALIFIPHTAGSTAVENDGLELLRALASKLPSTYAAAMQPTINALAGAMLQPTAPVKPVAVSKPAPAAPEVVAKPIQKPAAPPAPPAPVEAATPAPAAPQSQPAQKPLVADAATALHPL